MNAGREAGRGGSEGERIRCRSYHDRDRFCIRLRSLAEHIVDNALRAEEVPTVYYAVRHLSSEQAVQLPHLVRLSWLFHRSDASHHAADEASIEMLVWDSAELLLQP